MASCYSGPQLGLREESIPEREVRGSLVVDSYVEGGFAEEGIQGLGLILQHQCSDSSLSLFCA